ncbi:hypothetical protein ACFQ7N_36820 [Streptomyces niveus]|uniref:hypothetical protein n=1 Tax=Streptomyces niveus TaxID=193462 RepID=UPI0036933A00
MSLIPPPLRVARGATFDMYGGALPLGDWSYAIDGSAVFYGPGWYPLHHCVLRNEAHPAAPLTTRRVPTGRTRPAPVRLSPNTELRAWRNEYVGLRPYDHRVHADAKMFVNRRGAGAMTWALSMEIDLRAEEITVPDACPPELREQAEAKGHRVLALLLAARQERYRGLGEPSSALTPPPAAMDPGEQRGPRPTEDPGTGGTS